MDNIFTEGMMAGPDGTILRFFYDSEQNEVASTNSGRPIFDTVLNVDVITPGQKASTPRFEIERTFSDQTREVMPDLPPFRRSYKYDEMKEQVEKFKLDQHQHDMGGTPLKVWPRIDRGLQATLYAANIFTVEQLASISDQNMLFIGLGARELREQAKAWLEQAAGSADTSKLVGQVESLKTENTRLEADLARQNGIIQEMRSRLDKLEGPTQMKDII